MIKLEKFTKIIKARYSVRMINNTSKITVIGDDADKIIMRSTNLVNYIVKMTKGISFKLVKNSIYMNLFLNETDVLNPKSKPFFKIMIERSDKPFKDPELKLRIDILGIVWVDENKVASNLKNILSWYIKD